MSNVFTPELWSSSILEKYKEESSWLGRYLRPEDRWYDQPFDEVCAYAAVAGVKILLPSRMDGFEADLNMKPNVEELRFLRPGCQTMVLPVGPPDGGPAGGVPLSEQLRQPGLGSSFAGDLALTTGAMRWPLRPTM
jgi:hypothetical protein